MIARQIPNFALIEKAANPGATCTPIWTMLWLPIGGDLLSQLNGFFWGACWRFYEIRNTDIKC